MRKNKITALLIASVLVIAMLFSTVLGGCKKKPEPEPEKPTLESITLDTSSVKTTFDFAEAFTYEGLKVIANMSDKTTQNINLKDCTVKEPTTERSGTRNVLVTYEGKSASYKITVNKRVYPELTANALTAITSLNESAPYRVEAENIDMSKQKKAEGITSLIADSKEDEIVSGNKYLYGFDVKYNYFGFKFTADKAYEDVTLVLRLANLGENDSLRVGDVADIYLNYKDGEEEVEGLLSAGDCVIYKDKGWSDVVLRQISLLEGENTFIFDVKGSGALAIDYVDFYVGMRYISTVLEISENKTYVMEVEDFDTEKAFTRSDVASAHGLKDGQLFVETNEGLEGKPTSGGKSVGAIARGSQLSTTLRLQKDATVKIVFSASCVGKGSYYVKDHWKFTIDGIELKFIESVNIEGGDPGKGIWWDWFPTSLGVYNIPAGDHLFTLEAVGTDCNVDCFNFEIVSWENFDESGVALSEQHVCEHKCEICGKCTDAECDDKACIDKCEGHTAPDYDVELGTSEAVFEFENVRDYQIVTRPDFISAFGFKEGQFKVDSTDTASNGKCICGFMTGSIFNIKINVTVAGSYKIVFVGANDMDYSMGNLAIALDGTAWEFSGNLQGTTHDGIPNYWDWQSIEIFNGELTVGEHTLTVTVNGGHPNFDCIKFIPVTAQAQE